MEAAIVGLLSALIGIVLSNGFARVIEVRRRRDRMVDLMAAVHAEIAAGTRTAALQAATDEAHYAENDPIPFGPADETDFVFASIKNDLTILPIDVLHEIVLYYKLAAQSNLYTNDLKHPLFLQQTAQEKQKYMRNLLSLIDEQERAGLIALEAIETSAKQYGLDLKSKRVSLYSGPINKRANRSSHGVPPE